MAHSLPWLRALRHDPSSYFSSVNGDVLGCILAYMNTMPGAVDIDTLSATTSPFHAFCDPRRPPEILDLSSYTWTSIDVDNNGNYAALAVSGYSPHAMLAFCSPTTGEPVGHTVTLTYTRPGTVDDQVVFFARKLAIDRRTGAIALSSHTQQIVQLRSPDGLRVIATLHFDEKVRKHVERDGVTFWSDHNPQITGVTFDPHDGTLVVCDYGVGRLLVYTVNGEHVRTLLLEDRLGPTAVEVCPRSGCYVVSGYTGKFSVLSRITGDRLLVIDCARELGPLYEFVTFKVDSNDNVVLWRSRGKNIICTCATRGEEAGNWRVKSIEAYIPPYFSDLDTFKRHVTSPYGTLMATTSNSDAFVITPHGNVALLTYHLNSRPIITLLGNKKV
jgi:WD40 repeat protein